MVRRGRRLYFFAGLKWRTNKSYQKLPDRGLLNSTLSPLSQDQGDWTLAIGLLDGCSWLVEVTRLHLGDDPNTSLKDCYTLELRHVRALRGGSSKNITVDASLMQYAAYVYERKAFELKYFQQGRKGDKTCSARQLPAKKRKHQLISCQRPR